MKPLDLGTLFDTLAGRGSPTIVHLDRPLDVAPLGGTSYRMHQLAHLVAQLSGALAASGLRTGDRVAIVKENHWDIVLLAAAALRLGAVPALLDDRLPATTLRTLVGRLSPALLLGDARALTTLGPTGLRPAARTVDIAARAFVGSLHDLPPRRAETRMITHTSGTPRLVVHTARTLPRQAWSGPSRDDVVAASLRYAHSTALAWTAGVLRHRPRKLVIVADEEPRRALPYLASHRPTIIECLPSTYVRWQPAAARAHGPLRDVRQFRSTYDAVHPSTVRDYLDASHRRFPVWLQAWGHTETGPLAVRVHTRRHPFPRTVGWARVRLRVVDPVTREDLPAGREGLLLARARHATGLDAPEGGTWFDTGDIGVRDRFGGIRLLDRGADHVGGISCLEIEDAIDDRLPQVTECIVVASPDRLPVPVLLTPDGTLDDLAWEAAVADLPPLAPPVLLRATDVPRTPTGKPRRDELRLRLLADAVVRPLRSVG
jgi:acyl-coenzyme A synthetase/AMP-(fatty) acid ligase